MPHLATMAWDFTEHLHHIARTTGNQGEGEDPCPDVSLEAWYRYDAGKQRVRKRVVKQGGLVEERLYLGGIEIYRKYDAGGTLTLERETLHVMDDKKRIAMVETRTEGTDDSLPQLVRYQLGNHLGSASLELDETAQIISYEEYYPYGSTSYQAVRSQIETPKRYRYTGMERDEETGLNYHGARYYAVWLGRWISCDPSGIADGVNSYRYSKNNPIVYVDNNGFLSTPQELYERAQIVGRDLSRINRLVEEQRQRLHIPSNSALSSRLGISIGGWMHSREEGSRRVDFAQWYSESEGTRLAIDLMIDRLSSNIEVSRQVISQLQALEQSAINFDPELVLTIANQETRGRWIYLTEGMIRPPSDTFHEGGFDNPGQVLTPMSRYLPSGYTSGWRRVEAEKPCDEGYETDEHNFCIVPLTNVPYTQLIAAYGAYVGHIRESVVFGEHGLTEYEIENLNNDTLRFFTRLSFGASGAFRSVLGTMRQIALEQNITLSEVFHYHTSELISRHSGNAYLERALITVGEASILQQTELLGHRHEGVLSPADY